MSEKFVKKLNEAITSVIAWEVQAEKKSNTIGNPLTVNKKQIVIEIMNDITWFCVKDDIHNPIDK